MCGRASSRKLRGPPKGGWLAGKVVGSSHSQPHSTDKWLDRASPVHRHTKGPWTYVRRLWLMKFMKLGYSFNVHAWLPLCVAIWIGIVKNPDAPSKCWKEGRRLVITRLYLMWLLTRSHNMINHSLCVLVRGSGYDDHGLRALVRGLWVWRWSWKKWSRQDWLID